jgi:hypothetical protein
VADSSTVCRCRPPACAMRASSSATISAAHAHKSTKFEYLDRKIDLLSELLYARVHSSQAAVQDTQGRQAAIGFMDGG